MLPTEGGGHTGEVASEAVKDPAAGRERMVMTRRRTWTMRRPRVAGAEEVSRDLTVLATSGAEESLETMMVPPPQETRLTERGKTEDVAEAGEVSEVVEGSGVEEASEAAAVDSVEDSEAASGVEEEVIEEVTEGCHSEAAEAEAVEHHFVEVEAEEKAVRDNVTSKHHIENIIWQVHTLFSYSIKLDTTTVLGIFKGFVFH